jgi:UDP-3-O-[3-hydroxymyristoyl] glucosamine N-acyltransferase
VQAVAELVGGRLSGVGEQRIARVRSLESAGPDDLTVCAGERFRDALAATAAAAVLLPPALEDAAGPTTRIIVDDPLRAMALVARALEADRARPGVDPTARIGAGSRLGAECRIDAYAVIGDNVQFGDRVRIGPHVVVESGARLGNDVRLDAHVVVHAGAILGDRVYCQAAAVIGGAGFGFHSEATGHHRVPQVGGCILEDDVEVGSGSCIDRGSLDDTVIGRGTKLDNLVHIGHNVKLGEHCLVMAGVGVSGSTRVGHRVVLAGQAGLVGHIEIGDDARIGAQAGVIASVPPKGAVSGYPARPHREFLRAQAALYRLVPHIEALEALLKRSRDA